MKKINWGIIGLGKIAHKFAKDLAMVKTACLQAVASRDELKAKQFSELYYVNNYYSSYTDLMLDETIDIIYICTPNHLHYLHTIEALEHGKAVLCEKPYAINKSQVLKMIDVSIKNNCFLMEALWTRFMPTILSIKTKINEGAIGEIKHIYANFSFKAATDIQRIYDKKMGGGSLLDIGIYPVFLSYFLLGIPKGILAKAHYFDTGVDSQLALIFNYDAAQSMLFSSFNNNDDRIATICGTEGEISIKSPWNETNTYFITRNAITENQHFNILGRGHTYEILECHHCLTNQLKESKKWTHQNSIDLISLLDRIRKKINVIYDEDIDCN